MTFALGLSALLTLGQGQVRTVTPAQLPGFVIHHWGHYPDTRSNTPGSSVHNLFVSFDNLSDKEVASVDLKLAVYHRGRAVYERPSIHVDHFNDYVIHNPNGAPPGLRNFSNGPNPIAVDLPTKDWVDSFVTFEIVSLRVYEGPQDLHDLGHLWTWLQNTRDAEAVAAIERDSSVAMSANGLKYTALAVAYATGSEAVVRAMVKAAGFGTDTLPYGLTPMHMAVLNPHLDVMPFVRSHGGDPNAKAGGNQTPLMMAFFHRRLSNARWLLKYGADPNARSSDGRSMFDFALDAGSSRAVDLLLRAGAGRRGWMRRAAAHAPTNFDTLELLYRRGFSPDELDHSDRITPLMAAIQAGRGDAVRWLLRHGARLDGRDAQGRDAFDYAREADLRSGGGWYFDALCRWSDHRPPHPSHPRSRVTGA